VTYDLDLQRLLSVKLNKRAKYLDQRWLISKVIDQTHR